MTKRLHFAIPGDLAALTGGYAYDRRMIEALRGKGWDVAVVPLPGTFPQPGAADLAAAAAVFAALPDGALVLVDGLAFGAMPALAAAEASRLRWAALVHHPLALETGLSPAEARRLEAAEAQALAHARIVIVTSPATGRILVSRFAVPAGRIAVVPPGVDPAASAGRRFAAELPAGDPVILCVATITPRKGHETLIAALRDVADLPWTCRLVGDDRRSPETVERLRRQIAEAGLGHRVAFFGPVADVPAEFALAGLFALASHYEGYGMVFAEAMAHGLPIVACAAGAVPDVVPPEAGLLVPPADAGAFAAALRRLLTDGALRRRLAAGSHAAGQSLPGWPAAAACLSRALEGLEA